MKILIITLTVLMLCGCTQSFKESQYQIFSEKIEKTKGVCLIHEDKLKVNWTCYK